MRRSVWVVLGLVGLAPVGALAQQGSAQAGRAPAARAPADESQDDTDRAIIVELPAKGQPRTGGTASTGSGDTVSTGSGDTGSSGAAQVEVIRPRRGSRQGTGGSGMGSAAPAQQSATNVEVFQGTLRALEGGRLRMADANGNVYEFGLGQRTRIVGPDGASLSRQVLREGMPVRTVTQPGAIENEVITLQVFPAPAAPSR
jgi:hypothetical protein